ncbi:MAG: amino acid dehydrogenase, partial [Flavobacteriales bacterium]|nr:amino acid dehydrogenase [Flavobacteriales bacterium]
DRVGGIIEPEGLSHEKVRDLFLSKDGNALKNENLLSFEETNERIWSLDAEVFIPCAASRLITQDQINQMIETGIEVVACGANVPFADKEIFFGPIADFADNHISIIPDFISNCGMARVFAYLMSNGEVDLTDEGIFEDTSKTIERALKEVHAVHKDKTRIAKAAFEIALKKLI